MQTTENLNLNIIEGTDYVDWEVLNENFRTLEEEALRLDGALAAQEAENKVHKLLEHTLTAGSSYLILDLSGADLSRYREVTVHLGGVAATTAASIVLTVNDDTAAKYYYQTYSTAETALTAAQAGASGYPHGSAVIRIVGCGGCLCFTTESWYGGSDGVLDRGTYYGSYKGCELAGLNRLRVALSNSSYRFVPGMTAAVYGLAK